MASDMESTRRDMIRLLVKKINEAWMDGRFEELNGYFHDDMVIVGPDLRVLLKGRGLCVKSYQDFMGAAKVHEYKESEPVIELWGNTALATCGWEIAYEMEGKVYRDSGQDLFVFGFENET